MSEDYSAVPGSETVVAYANLPAPSGTGGYTSVAYLTDVKPPKIEADDVDVSNMNSANQMKEHIALWGEAGEVGFKVQFNKTQNATLYGLFRVQKAWQVQFSDGSYWTCEGYLKSFANEIEREKIITADISIKLSGLPVFTPAS